MRTKKHIVVYDIVANKKRKRLSDFLEYYGVRINKSVFLCEISNRKEYEKLLNELLNHDAKGDCIYIYPLCKTCYKDGIHLQYKPETGRKIRTTFVEMKKK